MEKKEDPIVILIKETWLTDLHGRCPVCGSRRYRETLESSTFKKECVDCTLQLSKKKEGKGMCENKEKDKKQQGSAVCPTCGSKLKIITQYGAGKMEVVKCPKGCNLEEV